MKRYYLRDTIKIMKEEQMLSYLHHNRFVLGSLVLCLFLVSAFYFGRRYLSRDFYAEHSKDTVVPIQSSKKSEPGNDLSQIPEERTVTAKVPEQIVEKARGSLVILEMEVEDRSGKHLIPGSGFFVRQGQIATCLHVVEGATRGKAKLVGTEQEYEIEGITASDEKHDLAILKVVDFGVLPLPLGNSDTVQVGEPIYVAGNPNGSEGKVTQGSISSIREGLNDDFLNYLSKRQGISPDKIFQMSAPIQPGNSGGPVLNEAGEVIGVSFMTFKGTQALNFSIPSSDLGALLKRLGSAKPLLQSKQAPSVFNYMFWGDEKIMLKQYEAAITHYDRAIRLEPGFAYAYFAQGWAKFLLGTYEAAIAHYDTGLRLQPNFAYPYNNRGTAKSALRQHQAAIMDFDQAIQLGPDFAEPYYNRGREKVMLGNYRSALADLSEAIRLKPDNFEAYSNRGLAKRGLGQHQAAISDFDESIRIKPDYAGAYYNRGITQYDLGNYAAAIADFDKNIQLKPSPADVSYNLADVYNIRGSSKFLLGNYTSALADFDEVIKLEPDYAKAYYNRGRAKFSLGTYKQALVDYDEAIRLKPDDAKAYYYRGTTKYYLGDSNSAIADYDAAIRLKPDSQKPMSSEGSRIAF